jgi:ppGpp synthetase/RelA/SpoT-type nucleotidyltranferase
LNPAILAEPVLEVDNPSDMAWAKPQYSKGRVDWAGEILADVKNLREPTEADVKNVIAAIEIMNNWRAVHSYPLQAMKMTLKRRAKRVCPTAIVAQRLKRLASIRLKLELSREAGNHPSLSQMQDIGGCRAILDSVAQVRKVETLFAEASKKNPHRGPQFSKTYDYIAKPKLSGYRSVHFVYRFRSASEEHSCYNSQRIEIQLRSRLQHYWATAVETYSTFTGEALKSNVGSEEWKRFFAVVSSAFALKEKEPTVPGTPATLDALRPELFDLYMRLNVENVLSGWAAMVKDAAGEKAEEVANADIYLLVLNPDTFSTELYPYPREKMADATARYAQIEKENPDLQAVLVSVDSVAALRTAYPNYFLDTAAFISGVNEVLEIQDGPESAAARK